MIFHLFQRFSDCKFVVITDYLGDVFNRYLEVFCNAKYVSVSANGTGTSSGIKKAMSFIPDNTPFMLIWSDLILGDDFKCPENPGNYVGLSESFECRWSYCEGRFLEEASVDSGVAGLFIFRDKSFLKNVPESGEFVRWLSESEISFDAIGIGATSSEYGLIQSINPSLPGKCRPFNSITRQGNLLIKRGIDDQGAVLAAREVAWYRHVEGQGVPIPKIHNYSPLVMDFVDGKNVFQYDFTREERLDVLGSIMGCLKDLHEIERRPADVTSLYEAYYLKTIRRLEKVRGLIPFAEKTLINVNGKACRNVFFVLDSLREKVRSIRCDHFSLIHGDCTFSNILLEGGKKPMLIDPRGYFGHTEIYGDPNYDWAKLYYSLCGDYDQFNLGRFTLEIKGDGVLLHTDSNGWRDVEHEFVNNLPADVRMEDIHLIHALIWLSLTTYAWNDYDSICASFYNGLFYLEDVL